jgi:xanthine dehydrogenase small subunit
MIFSSRWRRRGKKSDRHLTFLIASQEKTVLLGCMTEFWLNDRFVQTGLPPGMPLVDFIRRKAGLTAVKVGCREGDCGACVVLEGRLEGGVMHYQSVAACLMPLGRAQGRHIVTVEGLSDGALTPVQQLICDHYATQCGFCTPGIVLSLTAFCLSAQPATLERAIEALDGNLCRCTGYQSLKKAAGELAGRLPLRCEDRPVSWLVQQGFVPAWFSEMPERLARIAPREPQKVSGRPLLAGGTDLMVQAPDDLAVEMPHFSPETDAWLGIRLEDGTFHIGAGVTSTGLLEDDALRACFPKLPEYGRLIASAPIRNMGTLGGNLANASPIADWAIFLLALDASVVLEGPQGSRILPLDRFFKGYKRLAWKEGEVIAAVRFPKPEGRYHFHFEKVSKRRHLDIASVNSAAFVQMEGERMTKVRLSAGGVSPVPLFLKQTSHFLEGKVPDAESFLQALRIAGEEIAPISDIRGSAAYKKLLLRQLLCAHFAECFPGQLPPERLAELILHFHGKP